MKITDYIFHRLSEKISNHRVVVLYDAEGIFNNYVSNLDLPNINIVSTHDSPLGALRKAQELYRLMEKPDATLSDKNANLLIYIPAHRASADETRTRDPFESFAHIGTTFGDTEAEQLKSLAMQALPEFSDQIDIEG